MTIDLTVRCTINYASWQNVVDCNLNGHKLKIFYLLTIRVSIDYLLFVCVCVCVWFIACKCHLSIFPEFNQRKIDNNFLHFHIDLQNKKYRSSGLVEKNAYGNVCVNCKNACYFFFGCESNRKWSSHRKLNVLSALLNYRWKSLFSFNIIIISLISVFN